jgi:ABC-type sugar transport system substrate-binding protein
MAIGAVEALKGRRVKTIFVSGADGTTEECKLVMEKWIQLGVVKPIYPLVFATYNAAIQLSQNKKILSKTIDVVPYNISSASSVFSYPEMKGLESIKIGCGL